MNRLKSKVERHRSHSVRMYKIGNRCVRKLKRKIFWFRVKMFFFNRKLERRLSYEKNKQRRHQKNERERKRVV